MFLQFDLFTIFRPGWAYDNQGMHYATGRLSPKADALPVSEAAWSTAENHSWFLNDYFIIKDEWARFLYASTGVPSLTMPSGYLQAYAIDLGIAVVLLMKNSWHREVHTLADQYVISLSVLQNSNPYRSNQDHKQLDPNNLEA